MSGAVLKKIAVITMLTDHFGVAFFYIFTSSYDQTAAFAGADLCYQILRIVGRTSFPLFCFLLVEGFLHTRNVGKYILRLGLFSLLSEIPFDLAFYDEIWNLRMQNVFFTLLLGMIALIAVRRAENAWIERPDGWLKRAFAGGVMAGLCAVLAHFLRVDYGAAGVVLIVVLYVLRKDRPLACMGGYATLCLGAMNSWCFPAFVFLIPAYNGKKGNVSKYFFYVFYPAHLLVLTVIRVLFLKIVH